MAPSIQAIEVSRYRAFRDPQRCPLGRLTLVYGRNNAGKSALVRVPPLLAASRTTGRPGLGLDAPVLRGAGFREVQWRGALPSDQDPDLTLGVTLSDGATWRWTFQWVDSRSIAVLQRAELSAGADVAPLELRDLNGHAPKDAEYEGTTGRVRGAFDGIVPRSGAGALFDAHRDALQDVLESTTWLSAFRCGPTRGGLAIGAQGEISDDGRGTAALVLQDKPLRDAVSAWFRRSAGFDVVMESLGSEMQRLVLEPVEPGFRVPFPDAGEGLQQVFPLLTALERLRAAGGLLSAEEPESHLHPRLQRAVAEHVVDVLVAQPSASVMLETHSEVFLVAALRAAARRLSAQVRLIWVEVANDGAATIEEVPLDEDGYPTTPRLEQAFETMGVMRRELLEERREAQLRKQHAG